LTGAERAGGPRVPPGKRPVNLRGAMKISTAASAALLICFSAPLPADSAKPPRVVVLGFDGVDSQIVEQMLAAGRLPNLAALKARGGYSKLIPTVPAQTPVSWATFST